LKARTASKVLIAAGLLVMAFAILVHPPHGLGSVSARNIAAPGVRMFSQGGMTLDVSILAIGASVLVLGVVMMLRAGRLDTSWQQPLK